MWSRHTNHYRNEYNRLLDGAMAADERGDRKETNRIMREVRKAETALEQSRQEDERGWSESRWPSRRSR
ncbi:hypothetical protein [Glycomyces tenuis]|uniref:hypothetical protein n=1 Tax=Glycomyces tenuis TaxID=58116 RepID=UPI0003FBE502|nr:hypothetical protein [Glycomyces tenuis]